MLCFVRSLLGRFQREQTGAVIVETALILPLMITLSAGVFEFSNAIYTRLLIEAGVTDAARYIARCVHEDTDKGDCETAAKNIAETGAWDGTGSSRVTGWTPDLQETCGDPTQDDTIQFCFKSTPAVDPITNVRLYQSPSVDVNVIQVSATHAYAGTGLLGVLGFGPLTLSVSHQERVIGW
jgi:Flp pilus assembly protein TadG